MKVKITKLLHREIEIKKGSRKGSRVNQIRIWTNKHNDKMLSAFMVVEMNAWKVGDEVEIEVEQKGEYLNFKLPDKNTEALKQICDKIRSLEKRIVTLEQQLVIHKVKKSENELSKEPNNDLGLSNLPQTDEEDNEKGGPF